MVLAAIGLLAGCTVSPVQPTEHDPRPELTALLALTTDFQRELLEDGVVTYAELQRAFEAHLDCVRRQGFEGTTGEINIDGGSSVGIVWGEQNAPQEAQDEWSDTIDQCAAEYLREVNMWYEAPNQVTDDPYPIEMSTAIVSCMADKGARIAEVPVGWDEWAVVRESFDLETERLFRECEGEVSRKSS